MNLFLGFEAGGPNNALNVYNWSIIGDESSISVSISRTSCFERNKAALQMEVYCGAHKPCPYGVGISNPGYWGMVRKLIYLEIHTHTWIFSFFIFFLVLLLCMFLKKLWYMCMFIYNKK